MTSDSYLHKVHEGRAGGPVLFVFHGTGADENQFFELGQQLMPEATVIAPRGDVSEHGAARYFKRTGEGVYDMEDLRLRTGKMIDFVRAQAANLEPSHIAGLGYSNGANILASVLFAAPGLFDSAVLMHPLIPFEPKVDGTLDGTHILMTAGRHDPIGPEPLTRVLEERLKALRADVRTVWHEGGHELRPSELSAAQSFLQIAQGNDNGREQVEHRA